MKQLLLSFFALLVISAVSAQPGLQVLDQYDNDVTGKTITVYSNNPLAELLESHLKVRNSGDQELSVFLRRVNNSVVANSSNSFCFGVNCYPPFIDTSQVATQLGIGVTDASFLGDYYPGGGRGITSVTYEFYDNTTTASKISASVTVLYAVADVLDLFDEAGNLVNNKIINIHSTNTSAAAIMAAMVKVKNNSSVELFTYAGRIQNTVVPGSFNTFCYGVCYPPFVDTSSVVVQIPAGAIDTNFVADYSPSGNGGTTSLTFNFYDNFTLGSPVVATVTIEFTLSGVGIPENTMFVFTEPSPNPASSFTTFSYELPAQTRNAYLSIRNMLGSEINNVVLDRDSGKAVVNTDQLASGMYLYSLVIDGKISFTKKLIVKH